MGKQYQTRDGDHVDLIAVDVPAVTLTGDTVVGVATIEGEPVLWSWQSNGSWLTEDGCDNPSDLIEVPQAVTRWVNVYRVGSVRFSESRYDADFYAAKLYASSGYARIACIQVTYTEGEGL